MSHGITCTVQDGIATLTLAMEGRANKINTAFGEGLAAALGEALATPGVAGIVVVSGHKDFCVGADLEALYLDRDPAAFLDKVRRLGALYRQLETAKLPVVAVLAGSALGGGFELALACHHRVAVADPRIQLGLPEVNLGVIPGAGGTQRLARMLGIQPALEVMMQGKIVRAPRALDAGLVDALAPDADAARTAAIAWIRANPGARQPWDRGQPIPGPAPTSLEARNIFMAANAMLFKKTAGAFKAPEALLAVVQEGLRLNFDRALELEARAFTRLAVSDQAKDMIRTFFFHKNAADKHEGLPSTAAPGFTKVTVLGAGMMGAGIAYLCAAKGLQVVLKDIRPEAVEAGLAHVRGEIAQRQRHLSEADRATILARVHGTVELGPVAGSDLVIEAVVEDMAVKHRVIREVEPLLAPGAVFASNTSALPITDLAAASGAADRFIGLHYFSPVEVMPLLEIIRGAHTSDETVARCLAFARLTGKTPIVVNDGYAFYTTRVFSAYIVEGAQLVAEGHDPVLVEWAARASGMVVPPLQVFDEVTLQLACHAFEQAERYRPGIAQLAGARLVRRLVESGRGGKAAGAGFYDYVDGRRQGIWSGLRALGGPPPAETGVAILGRRLMYAQLAEVGRAMDAGILRVPRDADVGAVFGIGFAPATGGPLALMDRIGIRQLVEGLETLAATAGDRYSPPAILRRMSADNARFYD